MSEVAKGNAGSGARIKKSPSAYIQHLIGGSLLVTARAATVHFDRTWSRCAQRHPLALWLVLKILRKLEDISFCVYNGCKHTL